MSFGWLKDIFKKKKVSNTDTSDISTIDTSFVHVPKYSELSDENKLLVDKYIQEINPDDYESILKYSAKLLDRSNSEIEFFMATLNDIFKDISSVINEVNKENYFKLLLSKEEIKQSIDEFYKIIDEAKLRLIALNTYIKREEKRKFNFLGIHGRDARIKYLSNKSKLLNERDRLKTTIKISSQHLLATFNALKEEDALLNQMELYINSSKNFSTVYCDEQICKKYAQELIKKKQIIDHASLDFVPQNKINEFVADLEYRKVIPCFAREERIIKKYAYEHRNDYKLLINEMNALYNKYATTPSTKWDLEELKKQLNKYDKKIQEYEKICDKYINDDILKQMIESLWNLSFVYYICIVKKPFDLIHKDYMGYPETKYHKNLAMDLLSKIGDKYRIFIGIKPIGIIKNGGINENKLEIINSLLVNGELQYLYDICNNNYDFLELKPKIIRVPNQARFNVLSGFLDQKLDVEKEPPKMLSKNFSK